MMLSGCATSPHHITEESYIVKPVSTSYPKYVGIRQEMFAWPVKGNIITPFGVNGSLRSKGIDIKAREGSYVRAAKSGRVVYCDPNLKGFGKTVILDHGGGVQTVYAYNSDILVKVGDDVTKGAVIARSGATGRAREPSLHFEVRRNGEPQNPAYYLG
jgi:septal ring factor EnvC (AmiA/AmiB activator)